MRVVVAAHLVDRLRQWRSETTRVRVRPPGLINNKAHEMMMMTGVFVVVGGSILISIEHDSTASANTIAHAHKTKLASRRKSIS